LILGELLIFRWNDMPTHEAIPQENQSFHNLGERLEQERPSESNLNITEQQLKFEQVLAELTASLNRLTLVRQQPRKSIKIKGGVGSTTSKGLDLLFEIENPFKQDVMITEIDLIPDTALRAIGIVKIEANREEFYNSETVGYFANIGTDVILIPDGLPLERDENVKFFAKNNDGSTAISLSARVQFSLWSLKRK